MRLYTNSFGNELDLDAPETYSQYPDDITQLDNLMFELIGKALVYVKYFHPGWDVKQIKRINRLIADFSENRQYNYQNKMWFKEKVFLFEDETENLC